MKNLRWIGALLLSLVLMLGMAVSTDATEEDSEIYPDMPAAAVAVRAQMVARQPEIAVTFYSQEEESALVDQMMAEIFSHTGVPVEGDYLYWHCKKCTLNVETSGEDDSLRTMTFKFVYRSTAQQEAELDAAVAALLKELDLESVSDYEKIFRIYDYICNTVTYDDIGYLMGSEQCYTAYGALIGKAAVCQGYVSSFYRLALEVGVDNRIISGTSGGRSHGWNIVQLDGLYYNVDSTWDAPLAQGGQPYAYFLRSNENFPNHTPKAQFTTEEFVSRYPMSPTDYTGMKGDMDGNLQVNEDDAIYLLQHVLMAENFPISQPVDYTRDGQVDEDDAIYLLQYVLMPNLFPI